MPPSLTRVLLAEDDDFFMNPLKDALEDEKYQVLTVATIDGLIQYAAQANVLVIDARMSETELAGVACAARLIENGTVSVKVPIIFISVFSENDYVCIQELGKQPALKDRYVWLQKYFETDLLLERIREDLAKRSSLV